MKNFIQEGKVVTLVAPVGGVVSGNIVIISTLASVASTTEVAGEDFEGETEGVFEFTKTTADAPAQGADAYWEDTLKEVTVASAGNTLVGKFMKGYINGDTKAQVRMNAQ